MLVVPPTIYDILRVCVFSPGITFIAAYQCCVGLALLWWAVVAVSRGFTNDSPDSGETWHAFPVISD